MTPASGHGRHGGGDAAGQGGAFTRRRAVHIVAAAAGVPLAIAAVRATAPAPRLFRWQGEVLGAVSELALWHTDESAARRAIVRVRGEIARYERIFSLYLRQSEISCLNARAAIARPSAELVGLVETGRRFSELSGGAFDISVQPLWRLYEAHFWSRTDVREDLAASAAEVARTLVDWRSVDAGPAGIAFAKPGMAITLNSLAQGFVTDAATDLLRNEGFEAAVVDLGEFRTLGRGPDGRPWRIGIRDAVANAGGAGRSVDLEDGALAVSGGYGTPFEPSGRFHHIFDPHSGASAGVLADVAVTAATAVTANGLATAICVAGEAQAAALLAAFPGARATVTRTDGSVAAIGV